MAHSSDGRRRDRVLLLDDPGFFREFVAQALEAADLRPVVVDHEIAARSALDGGDIDLMVLEVCLAHLDAELFVAELKAKPELSALKVLGLSEKGLGRTDLRRLRKAGVDDFVSKLAPEEHLVFRARTLLHPAGADSRNHPRIAASLPVRWRSGGLSAWSRTLTLSQGGLFVRTDTPPKHGTSVWLEFGLPDSTRRIHVESVVVHVVEPGREAHEPPGFGVRFAGLSQEDREAIAAHVEAELGATAPVG